METRYVHEKEWAEELPRSLSEARLFNAPRPLYGEVAWEGEFRHGIHYAAIWPDTYRGDDLVEQNARLDVVELEFVNDDELRRMIREQLAAKGYSFEDYREIHLDINDAARDLGLPSLHDPSAPDATIEDPGVAAPLTDRGEGGTVRVLRVDVDGNGELLGVPASLSSLQNLIDGGWLEAIGGDSGSVQWHAYLDEEGKLKGLRPNLAATRLAERFGWSSARWDVLCGPVIFLGNGPGGNEADVPQELITDGFEQALNGLRDTAASRQPPAAGVERGIPVDHGTTAEVVIAMGSPRDRMIETLGVEAVIHARDGDGLVIRGRSYRVRDQRGWDIWDDGTFTLAVWNAAGKPTRVMISPTTTVKVAVDRRPHCAPKRARVRLDELSASGQSCEEARLPGIG